MADADSLLSTAEVATRFGVTRRAVTAWAAAGRLRFERTALGHHRYHPDHVDRLLREAVERGSEVESSAAGA